ncbi:MAG TPA: hypothetical protein VE053_03705 [Allosphingosinicella sp.]|nr:hypothetical protein [Allosphingosinicella sp.]
MDDCFRIGPGDGDRAPTPGGDEREGRRGELRAAVKRGLQDIEEGRVADLGEALDRIEAMLDELEATKRSDV